MGFQQRGWRKGGGGEQRWKVWNGRCFFRVCLPKERVDVEFFATKLDMFNPGVDTGMDWAWREAGASGEGRERSIAEVADRVFWDMVPPEPKPRKSFWFLFVVGGMGVRGARLDGVAGKCHECRRESASGSFRLCFFV